MLVLGFFVDLGCCYFVFRLVILILGLGKFLFYFYRLVVGFGRVVDSGFFRVLVSFRCFF